MSEQNKMLDELRRIRELLEPKPTPPPPPPPKGIVEEFIAFVKSYKVLGLAVAFIIGVYLGALVKALVDDLIMPIIQLVMPGTAWEAVTVGPFRIGHFVGAVITFIIILLVIFILVKMAKKWHID